VTRRIRARIRLDGISSRAFADMLARPHESALVF
jgi:hypothetical protein